MAQTPAHVGIGVDQNLPWATLVERWRLVEELGVDSLWGLRPPPPAEPPRRPLFRGVDRPRGHGDPRTPRADWGPRQQQHVPSPGHPGAPGDHPGPHVGGRLDVGLGAGWFVPEHEAFGLDFPAPGERVSRFREAVEVLDRLLRQERTTYAGRYYQLRDTVSLPRPIQSPRPPLMLAGHGPRMLRIIAEWGDLWNS